MNNYGNLITPNYNSYSNPLLNVDGAAGIWVIISLVLALVGCFLVYFMFVVKKDKPKEKFLAWLKGFLSFDKMLIEPILKVSYIFFALFITLSSFAVISSSFVGFLLTLILGNLFTRLAYEAILIMVMLWKNTTEIKNKMK